MIKPYIIIVFAILTVSLQAKQTNNNCYYSANTVKQLANNTDLNFNINTCWLNAMPSTATQQPSNKVNNKRKQPKYIEVN